MRIHFAYALPRTYYRPTRVFERLRRLSRQAGRILGVEPAYRQAGIKVRARPLRAPYSITYNLFRFLSERAPTLLYDLDERLCPPVQPDDIVIGHPHPDPQTVIQRLFREDVKCRAKLLIFPVHHDVPYGDPINRFTLPLVERADVVLAITGRYWYDTLDGSMFAPWKDKIVRLDMAVDTADYPLVKKHFNPPGRRGYLHIGSGHPRKGMGVLDQTMAGLSEFPRASIGPGTNIPNMRHLASDVHLTPEFVSALAQDYDFFVCTPQSGYYNMPSIIALSTTDIEANVKALRELQHMPEEHLLRLTATNRNLVETHYTWERFCATVWQALEPFLRQGDMGA